MKSSQSSPIKFYVFDMLICLLLITALSPIWVVNVLCAWVQAKSYSRKVKYLDHNNTVQSYSVFCCGVLRSTLTLMQVPKGQMSLLGQNKSVTQRDASNRINVGVFSLSEMQDSVGNIAAEAMLERDIYSLSLTQYLGAIVRAFISSSLYKKAKSAPDKFKLFGVRINNYKVTDAMNWIFSKNNVEDHCRSLYFVNVNSINLSYDDDAFKKILNQADLSLADGSGVRLGAKHKDIQLKDNLNGTDLLPHVCRQAKAHGKSIFLLGGAPGVANKTAANLKRLYPGIRISGCHDGYFSQAENNDVLVKINQSGADIVLVAMGSPYQETWIHNNKEGLTANVVMAVGGLFDFYSGEVSRAPMWMRDIGMEWVYRLIQQPADKFNRYVVGNPIYMWRTYILDKA